MDSRSHNRRFSDFPLDQHHANSFGLLRYLLAVLVILSHSFPLLYGDNTREPFMVLSRGQYSGGSIAVDLFLIVSGFLVTHSWTQSKSAVLFLSKRIRRVYPGYLAAAAVSLALVWVLDPIGRSALRSVATSAAFWLGVIGFSIPPVPGFLESNPFPHHINGSLWTISYEFGCYLLLTLLGIAGAIRRRRVMASLLLLFWGIYSLALHYAALEELLHTYHLHNWVRLISCFLAGSVCYLYRDRIPYSPTWAGLGAILLVVLFFSGRGFVAMLPIIGAYELCFLAFARGLPGASLGQRNDLSYGIYLYAFPVQQVLVASWQHWLNPWTLFVTAWGITAVCAWASWTYIERPFLRRAPAAPRRAPQ